MKWAFFDNFASYLYLNPVSYTHLENDQGFPETEKLLLLSNVLNVSIDYLLKSNEKEKNMNPDGFYVSKEMADGFLYNERKSSNYVACGIFSLILIYIPFIIFKYDKTVLLLNVMTVCLLYTSRCV